MRTRRSFSPVVECMTARIAPSTVAPAITAPASDVSTGDTTVASTATPTADGETILIIQPILNPSSNMC